MSVSVLLSNGGVWDQFIRRDLQLSLMQTWPVWPSPTRPLYYVVPCIITWSGRQTERRGNVCARWEPEGCWWIYSNRVSMSFWHSKYDISVTNMSAESRKVVDGILKQSVNVLLALKRWHKQYRLNMELYKKNAQLWKSKSMRIYWISYNFEKTDQCAENI